MLKLCRTTLGASFLAILISFDIYCAAYATGQDIPCIAKSETRKSLYECTDQILEKLVEEIDNEFSRFSEKHKDNSNFLLGLKLSKDYFYSYANRQCVFEGALASDEGALASSGQLDGHLPIEADRATVLCFIRIYTEMKSVLSKY